MKTIKLFAVICFLSLNVLHAQEGKLDFASKKELFNGYVVYFLMDNVKDAKHASTIVKQLQKQKDIKEAEYYIANTGQYACKLIIGHKINANQIKEILLKNGADYNYQDIIVDGRLPAQNIDIKEASPTIERTNVNHSGFPIYRYTENKEQDDKDYAKAKAQWIEDNPEEYKMMLNDLQNNAK